MDRSIRGALLPHLFTLTGNRALAQIPGGIFSVALSVKSALSEPPRPLAGMLPCGDRTFLPPTSKLDSERPPVQQAHSILAENFPHTTAPRQHHWPDVVFQSQSNFTIK